MTENPTHSFTSHEAQSIVMDPHIQELLARYLAGAATRQDEAELRRWIAAEPPHRAALEGLMQALTMAGRLLEARESSLD